MKKKLMLTPDTREAYNLQMHTLGRIFTWLALFVICMVPVAYSIAAKTAPDWGKLAAILPFVAGYWAIGLIEAFSYAPLLGTSGQYLSFITGNISNLKLPAAINAQTIAKVEKGSEEQEIVTTIAISISSIVTTLIIAIGLIPLIIFQEQIVKLLTPISPYVMPSIFGALTLVVVAMYAKIAAIPFIICILVSVIANLIGKGDKLNVATMIIVGMIVSGISTTIMYTVQKKKQNKKDKEILGYDEYADNCADDYSDNYSDDYSDDYTE